MRKGIIVNLKKFKLLDYMNLNKIFILLTVMFVAGIAVSAAIYNKNPALAGFSKKLFNDYILLHTNVSFIKKFFSCFVKYVVILFIYFLFGTSMLGVAVVPFLTFWQGIIVGSISAHLYTVYALKGIAFNAIVMVPSSIIFTICTFFAAKESIGFSLLMAKLTLPNSKPASMYTDFRKFCAKFVIIIGVLILNAVVDVVLNMLFLKFFNF